MNGYTSGELRMQSKNEKENTSISEEEIDKVIDEAKKTSEAKPEETVVKTNPNKDLIPQRVKLKGIGYIDLIGTKERDATFESIKTLVFKVLNAAFTVTEIDVEEGTFKAKLMNYSPLVREKEENNSSLSSSSDS